MHTKILLVSRNLPPLVGGMEKLNFHMIGELSAWSEVHVIGPKQNQDQKQSLRSSNYVGVQAKPVLLFLFVAFFTAIIRSKKTRFDYIIAGSGLTAPIAWICAKMSGAKCITYIHGLDIDVNNRIYQAVWVPILKKMDLIIANSETTLNLAVNRGIDKHKIIIIHPGVRLPIEKDKQHSINRFCNYYKVNQGEFILSVGRLTTRKGLQEFVQHSLPAIIQAHPHIQLVVIGDTPTESLLAKTQSKETIKQIADSLGIGKHLRFIGVITDTDLLSGAYWSAAAHIFPVRNLPNDPEGFGMVAIESAAHGLPTIAFATGGTQSSVLQGASGLLIESENYSKFAEGVIKIINNKADMREQCIEFAQKFSWANFGASLHAALRKLIQETNKS